MSQVDNSVRAVLSGRAPVFLSERQTVREAATLLSEHDIGAAPVLAGDRLVGIFTERDILRRVVAEGRDADRLSVADAMTPEPKTVSAETPLVKAFALMIEGRFRHLPVVDAAGHVVAVLSMRDVPPEHRIMHRQWTEWTNGKAAVGATAASARV